MRKLTYVTTLLYYDYHHLIIMTDEVDTKYFGMLTSVANATLEYCLVPVSKSRYNQLINNLIDVRDALTQRETINWYLIRTHDITSDETAISVLDNDIPDKLLPDAGLMASPPNVSDELIVFARERANIVSEITLDPIESINHALGARTLSAVVDAMQGLVKRAVLASRKKSSSKRPTGTQDAYLLDVCALAPGSFKIRFESKAGLDLLGDSELEKALDLINTVLSSEAESTEITKALEGYKGHFVSSLIKLLKIVEENETYIRLNWAKPNSKSVHTTLVEKRFVSPLLEVLSSKEEMAIERVSFTGVLKQASSIKGTWCIIGDEDKKEHSGLLSSESNSSLSGLEIEGRYRVDCIEKIIDIPFTMKEDVKLYAVKFTPLFNA